MYFYIKALHIIFIVTWFSGLFYIVRLFVYTAEAHLKPEPERTILISQLSIMQKRLWYGITWPSAVLTLVFGIWMWQLYGSMPGWLIVKLFFVAGLYIYHFSLHAIFRQQQIRFFRWTSQQLRIWNEVATLFLLTIVMLAVVKQLLSVAWAMAGLVIFSILLMLAIQLYKKFREK
ncbi:MAG: CopD family protein [Ginsengibacter sp.]